MPALATRRPTHRSDLVLAVVSALVVVFAGASTLTACGGNSKDAVDAVVSDAGDAGASSKSSNADASTAARRIDTGKVPTGTMNDCTPVRWDNPGGVANPDVVAVSADAGQTGHMFGRSKGLPDNYVEQEFFFTGSSPAYTTRMVVHRPKNSSDYNGSVLVEWYNVSGQLDFAPEWAWNRNYFMRTGWVHIAVSAQAVGANALKTFDPERYEAINHPGDDAAPDIFSQAGTAIRLQSELLLGKCMPVNALIAAGQSQSSFQLAGYTDSKQPNDKVYDGIVLHSGLEPASNEPSVPVFELFTMTEGNNTLSDGAHLVKWVVAGATHSDATLSTVGLEAGEDLGTISAAAECVSPLNTFPAYRVYSAAFDWMNRWVRDGVRPPRGTPLGMGNDNYGNARGGVRLPEIAVPIATYGANNSAAPGTDFLSGMACSLGGSTTLFSSNLLHKLYPTHDDYVNKYTKAADQTVSDGYMLQADRDVAVQDAANAAIPE